MPSIIIPVEDVGPTLEVGIAQPASILGGATAQTITWFKAIADTGCSHTSIHSSVATACALSVLGKGSATTPAGQVAVNLYHGDLFLRSRVNWTIPFEWKFNDRTFCEMVHPNPSFDCLLGMDILMMGTFAVIGGTKQASFSW